jgi:hypothetical protein
MFICHYFGISEPLSLGRCALEGHRQSFHIKAARDPTELANRCVTADQPMTSEDTNSTSCAVCKSTLKQTRVTTDNARGTRDIT